MYSYPVKDPSFRGIVNPYQYVDYTSRGAHFKQIDNPGNDYLWTNHVSYCVVIGFVALSDSGVQKIGVYHSVSEHSLVSNKSGTSPLMSTLSSFLKNIDPLQLQVVIGYNKDCIASTTVETTCDDIKALLNHISKKLNQSKIPDDNYKNFVGSDTFYLSGNQNYGDLNYAAQKAILEIQSMILDFLENSSTNSTFEKILDVNSTMTQALNDFKQIKNIVAASLNEGDASAQEEKLYHAILGWDPVLEASSEILLQDWLQQITPQEQTDLSYDGDEFYDSDEDKGKKNLSK